jgi:hypothetical protein
VLSEQVLGIDCFKRSLLAKTCMEISVGAVSI